MLIVILLCAFFFTACEQKPQKERSLAIPVETVQPTIKNLTPHLEAIGVLLPSYSIDIHPHIPGILQEVLIHDGDFVKTGTALFQLDDENIRIKMREAEAQMLIDMASLEAIERKLTRYSQLQDKELVAAVEWDRLQTEKARAQGAVELDQARIEMIAHDLSHCTMLAPQEGRVGKIAVSIGQSVTPSSLPLTTLIQSNPLFVEFRLTENELHQLTKDSDCFTIIPFSFPNPVCRARLVFIDNQFDAHTGQILLKGVIENAEGLLRPGQLVKVKIPIKIQPETLLIPVKSLRHGREGPYVYIVNNEGKLEKQHIVTGDEIGDLIAIKEGLTRGQRIVTNGLLRAGAGVLVDENP